MDSTDRYSGSSVFYAKDRNEDRKQEWENDALFTEALQEVCLDGNFTSLVDAEITITGTVLGDGKGDLAHINSMAQTLIKLFPEQKIAILPLVHPIHKGKIKGINKNNVSTEFTYLHPALKKIKDGVIYNLKTDQGLKQLKDSLKISTFPKERVSSYNPQILERLRKSALVIKMSTDVQDTGYRALTKNNQIVECFFREYGVSEFRQSNTMGLAENQTGIFIKKAPKKRKDISELDDKALLNLLFQNKNPDKEVVKNYFSKSSLNLAYMHDYEKFRFIKTLIFLLNMDGFNNNKNVDICIPLDNLNKIKFTRSDHELFESTGVGKIVLIEKDKNNNFIVKNEIQTGSGEREIRLINCFPLSKSDMKILMCFEQPAEATSSLKEIIGCTGDSSCAEVLSYSKVPFYEYRSHKYNFYQELIYLTNKTVGKESPYYKYLITMLKIGIAEENFSSLDSLSENVGKFLSNFSFTSENSDSTKPKKRTNTKIIASKLYQHITSPGFIEDAVKVADQIRANHSANTNLVKIILTRLIRVYKSNVVSKLYEEYIEKKINLEEIKKRFSASTISS